LAPVFLCFRFVRFGEILEAPAELPIDTSTFTGTIRSSTNARRKRNLIAVRLRDQRDRGSDKIFREQVGGTVFYP
jgi:hypothetical protein